MQLNALLHGLDVDTVVAPSGDIAVHRVTLDSRKAMPGVVFVAAKGVTAQSKDGHEFLASAVALGVSAIIVARGREAEAIADVGNAQTPVYAVDAPRVTAAVLAERVFGSPSDTLNVVGVTGTNGKTTSTFVLAQALGALGDDAAVFGTLGVGRPQERKAFGFTTPEAEVLSEKLADLLAAGVKTVAMEVSSHALATARSEATHFRVAAFTNFTQDHLDFHGTMDAYLAAKARLFTERLASDAVAVLPLHEDAVMRACAACPARVLTWAPDDAANAAFADVSAEAVTIDATGIHFTLRIHDERAPVTSPLLGRFNLENLLVAGASMFALGISPRDVARGLSAATGVPGRMEQIHSKPLVVVDYAHTPDAIERALGAMRALTPGKLIVVFGAGGDRDASKRAPMGRAAATLADAVVLTSDNPRFEDPKVILDQLEDGVRAGGLKSMIDGRGFVRVEDRAEAIAIALELADVDDAVLIAGKGDERTQTIGSDARPFVDRDVARNILAGSVS